MQFNEAIDRLVEYGVLEFYRGKKCKNLSCYKRNVEVKTMRF